MSQYPFKHDGPVFEILDDDYDVVYYARDGKKYKRVRHFLNQTWEETTEIPVPSDVWWMTVACIERKARHASY